MLLQIVELQKILGEAALADLAAFASQSGVDLSANERRATALIERARSELAGIIRKSERSDPSSKPQAAGKAVKSAPGMQYSRFHGNRKSRCPCSRSKTSPSSSRPPAARSAPSTACRSWSSESEVLAIVGESGSGKSVSMLAVMGLLPWTAKVTADRLHFDGRDLLSHRCRARAPPIIGKDMAMIFQEPMSSLNPCFTVGFQLTEALKTHLDMDKAARRTAGHRAPRRGRHPGAETRLEPFRISLSGGMSQRVMIAMAIACKPKLLIADEPTTALDVTIQAQILDLLLELQRETGMALVLITHSMGVVAETAERVSVQYAGQKVEEQPVMGLFADPASSLHRGPACRPAGACPRQAPALHSGRGARPVRPPVGLPVLAALPLMPPTSAARHRPSRRDASSAMRSAIIR